MGLLNLLLGAFAAFLIATGITKDPNADKEKGNVSIQSPHEIVRPKMDFVLLKAKAKKLQESAYLEVKPHTSRILASLPYEKYKKIRFLADRSLWKKDGSAFQIQFLPPGHLYNHSVYLNELIDDVYQGIPFLEDYFDWSEVGDITLSPEIGHTGFKIHYPINTDEHTDEFAVFQGSSYFRIVSKGQTYGLSARGLSINTGIPNVQEEFPIFKEFWIKKPGISDSKILIYALLDSKSATAAFRFEIIPGETTKSVVSAEIYLRKPVEKLGLTPLTSMFWYGENSQIPPSQVFPEVHDSDGLQIQTNQGEMYWRPIDNPKKPNVHPIDLDSPKGYGLIQRDRDFASYEDANIKYHQRPSAWVEPNKSFGKGTLQLFRFPTKLDSDDNVTMIWVPDEIPEIGQPINVEYTIYWNVNPPKKIIYVVSTRSNQVKDGERQFFIDFKGESLQSFNERYLPTPVVESWNEPIDISNVNLQMIPESEKIRLSFSIPSKHSLKSTELKAYLKEKEEVISEIWITTYDHGNQ
jgi:glucans biosynthesis protein